MGKQWKQLQTLFSWAPKPLQMMTAALKLKRHLLLGRKAMTNLDSILKAETLLTKVHLSQSYDFSSSHVWMWELSHKESWALKNWCFWSVVLEKTLESPLDYKEIKPVHPKGNQSWVFIGSTDAEAETPVLWSPAVKNWLIGQDLMLGKIEGKRRGWQRMRWLEDKLNGREFEQGLRVGDGQGSLACCSPWGFRVGHDWVTELNWTESAKLWDQKVIDVQNFILPNNLGEWHIYL